MNRRARLRSAAFVALVAACGSCALQRDHSDMDVRLRIPRAHASIGQYEDGGALFVSVDWVLETELPLEAARTAVLEVRSCRAELADDTPLAFESCTDRCSRENPFDLPSGSSEVVSCYKHVTIASDEMEALCRKQPWLTVVVYDDSLGHTQTVRSEPFTVSGCR